MLLQKISGMEEDENQLSKEVRSSQLVRQVEKNQSLVEDHQANHHRSGSEPQLNSQTLWSDSDSGHSDISTENGETITKHFRQIASNLETLVEKSTDFNIDNRTFSDPDKVSNSQLTDSDNNEDNNGDTEETTEQTFCFKTLTKEQKIILASTSFTNFLSFLSISILAPFFPKEVEYRLVLLYLRFSTLLSVSDFNCLRYSHGKMTSAYMCFSSCCITELPSIFSLLIAIDYFVANVAF